jgi:transcriptional regulator with XRE-family HTH domain
VTVRETDLLGKFGHYLRDLRHQRQLTQEQLAARTGVDLELILRMERGEYSPELATIGKLCLGFDLVMSDFFEGFEGFEEVMQEQ